MPNDTQHKIRVVAEFFAVDGWKPDTACTEVGAYPAYDGDRCMWTCACGDSTMFREFSDRQEHAIPPPDLLAPAGAWALEDALWKRGFYAMPLLYGEKFPFLALCTRKMGIKDIEVDMSVSRAVALLDAAYQLATKEQQL